VFVGWFVNLFTIHFKFTSGHWMQWQEGGGWEYDRRVALHVPGRGGPLAPYERFVFFVVQNIQCSSVWRGARQVHSIVGD